MSLRTNAGKKKLAPPCQAKENQCMHVMHCKPQGSKIWKKVQFSSYLAFATASIYRPNFAILFYDLYPFIILLYFTLPTYK